MTRQTTLSGFYSAATAMIISMGTMSRYDKSRKDWQANAGSYDRCPDCGAWKAKKAYRCRACSPLPLEAAERRWNPDATDSAKRMRLHRRLRDLGTTCSRCGETKSLERHHIDGDPGNNDLGNISVLCRRCHMEVDGRLAAFVAYVPPEKPPKPCVNCGKLYKPLRRGLCHACNERQRREKKRRECHRDVHEGRLKL
jgi:hypothetical protein